MKKHTLKRCAAVLAACATMASALPVMNLTVSAEPKNIISNSTFESSSSGWGIYKESGGKGYVSAEDGKLAINVESVGKVNYAVQGFYDIIPLYQNGVYRFSYEISSTIDRPVEVMIQQNGGTYQSYTWKGLDLTSEPQVIDYEFVMEEESDIMAKLCINCGIYNETELPEHTIYVDNVVLELIDDSKVDYSTTQGYEPPITTNQLGYKPNSKKTAVFRDITDETSFSVVNADTEEVVYTGELYGETLNTSADETNWLGDFSEVKAPGKYYIKCGSLDASYTFEIGDDVYLNLLDESVRMLYLQRCGTAIEDEDFDHVACHTGLATVYGTSDKIDVSGGWHDAGDYGRYIVPAAKTVADLLYAYQKAPELYSDNIGIPESGNGIADILDETRYELEWMLKMQAESGGVYHKVTCEKFPGYVMPEDETLPLIVTPVSTTATADFCASMALAYEFYLDIDKDFAESCLAAAEKAWSFLEANPDFIFKNPADITTGDYGDKSDADERYWAAAQMYRATGEDKYLTAFNDMRTRTGMDWSTVGDYGNIAILTMDGIDKNSELYSKVKSSIISEADDLAELSESSPYGVALGSYYWGSNMGVANAGVILGHAYDLTGDSKYLNASDAQLHYLLGTNPLGYSFVTGFGTVAPENPHHRPSMAVGKAMPGMLVGGVNAGLEDSAAKAHCQDKPAAKRYVDNSESYSTNEITIYWNSPLTYLLSFTETSEKAPVDDDIVWGDSNCDGEVNMADAVFIMQSIANPNKYALSDQGALNADVYENGTGVTNSDALSIQRFKLGLIESLPEVK